MLRGVNSASRDTVRTFPSNTSAGKASATTSARIPGFTTPTSESGR